MLYMVLLLDESLIRDLRDKESRKMHVSLAALVCNNVSAETDNNFVYTPM